MPKLQRLSRKQYLRLLTYVLDLPEPQGTSKKAETQRQLWLGRCENTRELLEKLEVQMKLQGTIAHVGYENLAMDSSQFGQRKYLPVGEIWSTLKTVEQVTEQEGMGTPIGTTPSTFCYPQYLWIKPRNDEDAKWEALQDVWDANHPAAQTSIGRRSLDGEKRAQEWVEQALVVWRAQRGVTA